MFENADVIYSYTRKQAIEDGVLIDITTLAKEAGIKFPVAVTSTLYGQWIETDEQDKSHGQSEDGRLWDLLNMFRFNVSMSKGSELTYKFIVYKAKDQKQHEVSVYAVIGPGDEGEPVITLMFPGED